MTKHTIAKPDNTGSVIMRSYMSGLSAGRGSGMITFEMRMPVHAYVMFPVQVQADRILDLNTDVSMLPLEASGEANSIIMRSYKFAMGNYVTLRAKGIPPGIAAAILPLAMPVDVLWVWDMDLMTTLWLHPNPPEPCRWYIDTMRKMAHIAFPNSMARIEASMASAAGRQTIATNAARAEQMLNRAVEELRKYGVTGEPLKRILNPEDYAGTPPSPQLPKA